MIFFVWMAACIISLAPVFGWKDAEFEWRITNDQECLVSQDIGYQIFATITTFYFPLTLTLIFYWKIYQVSRPKIRIKSIRLEAQVALVSQLCESFRFGPRADGAKASVMILYMSHAALSCGLLTPLKLVHF